jgi:dUTP pyrophosphatase
VIVQVKIVNPAIESFGLPEYATKGAAGLDLRACIKDEQIIRPGETIMIPTGIAIHIGDPGYAALVLPRSGLGAKKGLVLGNLVGLIDSDYQGELMVAAWNRHPTDVQWIEPGMRLAQLMVVPVMQSTLRIVKEFTNASERGTGGWGSTGVG